MVINTARKFGYLVLKCGYCALCGFSGSPPMCKQKIVTSDFFHEGGIKVVPFHFLSRLVIHINHPLVSEADLGLLQHPRWSAL